MSGAILEMKNISKNFGSVIALKNVNRRYIREKSGD